MNNFEVIKLLNKMSDVIRGIAIGTKVVYIKKALAIDKNVH